MTTLKKYSTLFIALVFAAFGISITMKAAIGLAPFDAFNQTFAHVLNFRVGDIVTIVQTTFVIIQLLILRKKPTWRILLQVPLATIMGQFINIFFYDLFGSFVIDGYILRSILFLIGQAWTTFFISAIMVLDLVTMPVESLSQIIADKTNRPFGQLRQVMDVLFIIFSLLFTFIFSVPFTIREGTVIGALTFGPLLSFFMPKIKDLFTRWQLIE